MLRRALLAVAVLSYLICVLVLSGGQKDDLNVNTLSKLHDSNVNVKNILSNEDLYRNCRLNSSNVEILKSLLNSSSIQQIIKELHDVPNDGSSTNTITDISITEIYENNKQKTTKPHRVSIARDKRTAITNNNFEEHTTFLIDPSTTKKKVKYTDNKPNLKNVISFWQRFGKKNEKDTTDDPKYSIVQESNNNKLSKFLNNSNIEYYSKILINNDLRDKDIVEGEYLRNILPPYIPQQMSTPTSTTPASSVDFVTDDDTDIFKYILESPDNESVEKHDMNAHLNQYSYEINYSKIKYKNKKSKHKQEFLEKDEKLNNINHYGNFKSDNSQHSISNHEEKEVIQNKKSKYKQGFLEQHEEPNNINDYVNFKSDNSQHRLPIHEEKDVKYTKERTKYLHGSRKPEVRDVKIYRDDHTTSTLPPEIIKKIAEDVKALILKDLHKNLRKTTTTILPLVTIAKGLGDLIPRYNAGQNLVKPYPLTKILDILQKYKNGDIGGFQVHNREPNGADAVHNTPKLPQYPNEYPYYLPIENKLMKSENNLPYMNPHHSYKYQQSKKISPRSKLRGPKPKPFVPIRDLPPRMKSIHMQHNFKSTPITLQTNLIEIPPLGVPVSDPLSFINHHIVISTRRPFRHKQRNLPTRNEMKNRNTIRHKPVRTRNVNTRINKDVRHNDYSYKDKKRNQQEMVDKRTSSDVESRELKKVNPRDVYRVRTQNNIKKFHEKLEQYPKVKYKAENAADCCKDEIFTSEQLAPDNVKSRDEASFKNLLQTQQKVTDMLTQMLAKRKKEDLPLSVETT